MHFNDTITDRCPTSHLQNLTGALFGKEVLPKIDLVRAFHQILFAPEDIPEITVTTLFGLLEFIRMLFNLRNADQTFQRFFGHVLRGQPFVYAYINYLQAASEDAEKHKKHLALVFNRLGKNGFILDTSKCVFGVSSLEFLDRHFDSEGLRPPYLHG
ncbi:hypothetical protein SprV_0602187300 [Sparganum proliferum]